MARLPVDRERVLRTLTFWLRPDFVLRVVNRFQRIAGFDRSIALASSALTALVPLLIFTSALLPASATRAPRTTSSSATTCPAIRPRRSRSCSRRTPASPPGSACSGSCSCWSRCSASRARCSALFEQVWELPPLSVRNSLNGLKWIAGLLVYSAITGTIRGLIDKGPAGDRLGGRAASAVRRVLGLVGLHAEREADRLAGPGPVRRRRGRAARALFDRSVDLYAASVRDLREPLRRHRHRLRADLGAVRSDDRGRRQRFAGTRGPRRARPHSPGERPSDDEVQKQWNEIISEARSRWAVAREEIDRRRAAWRQRRGKEPAEVAEDEAEPEEVASGQEG